MKRIIILLMLLVPVILFSQVKYYWDAVNGNDARSSTQAQNPLTPWRTIKQFNTMFSSFNAGDSILFRVGQIFPDTTIGMTMGKSGTIAAKINIGRYFGTLGTTDAANAPNPVVSGLYTIPSWTATEVSGVFRALIPNGINTTGVVLMDGQFQVMGKLPKGNQGYYNVTSFNAGTNTITSTNSGNGTTSFSNSGAPNIVGAGDVVWRAFHWDLWRGNVIAQGTTSGPGTGTIQFTPQASTSPGGAVENPQATYGFFIQNNKKLCTSLGEWAYNTVNDSLYVYFGGAGPNGHIVQISNVNTLCQINGSFISINNITFNGGNVNGIIGNGVSNVTINGCAIKNSGVYAAFLNGACINWQFVNDTIRYANANGIRISSSANTTGIIGCDIQYCGNYAGMGGSGESLNGGIMGWGANSYIYNNIVRACGHIGINASTSGGNSNNFNSIVRFNFVDSFGYACDDAAGIYWRQQIMTGTKILRNIVLNGKGAPIGTPDNDQRSMGLYNDDGATNIEVDSNTVAFCGRGGLYNHAGNNLTYRFNTLYDNGPSGLSSGGFQQLNDGATPIGGLIFKRNISFAKTISPAELVYLSSATGGLPNTWFAAGGLDSNMWCRPLNETNDFNTHGTIGSLAQWKTATGQDLHAAATPWSITDTSELLFLYNNTLLTKTFAIGGTALDVFNVSYTNNVTLAPFTSIILKRTTTNPPLVVNASASPSTVACANGTSTINASATGGSGGYQFKLGNGALQISGQFNNVAPGTYTVTVQDGSGATASTNVTIFQPQAISISQVHGTILVNGGNCQDTVTASGGTGTLMYSMDGGVFQSANTFTITASPSPHTIVVRDANLCTNQLQFTVTQPSALVVNIVASQNPVTCYNGTTTIKDSATGATPPYQYSNDNGATFRTSNIFLNQPAGPYNFVTKDAAGATVTTPFTLNQPAQILFTEKHGTISVNGGSTSDTVTVTSGGVSPFTYSITAGRTFQSSNIFTLVKAGTDTIIVKDANGCTNQLVTTIIEPSVLVVSASATTNPLSCYGNLTNINVSASGGTTPYSYQLNGGTPQLSAQFTNQGVGNYTITVTDHAGAVQSTSLTITQPNQITVSESHGVICCNGGTTSDTLTANGGTGTLVYSITNGRSFQSSNIFTNVPAGTDTAVVKDANNCTKSYIFSISQPSLLIATAAITTAIPCNGSTGVVTIHASGGTTPYQFKLGTGSYKTDSVFSGLAVGTYNFTILDAGGAIVSASATLSQPAQIVVGVSVVGNAPANVTVNVTSGGVNPLNYKLDNGQYQIANTFSGVSAGNHTATVKDANNCTQMVSFAVNSTLGITLSYSPLVCNGDSTTVMVNATGGSSPFTGTGNFIRKAGTWTFTVHDNTGASHDTTITITEPAAITISESNTTITTNGGTCTVMITAMNVVGTPQYSLDGGAYQSGNNTFLAVSAGNHSVSVKDGNGCIKTAFFSISQPGVLGITISLGTAINCFGGKQFVTVGGNGGTTPYKFTVDNGTFTSTTIYASFAGTHTYSVKDTFNNRKDTILTINQPSQVVVTNATYAPIGSPGGNTTVTIVAGGGTPALQYSLDGSAYQVSASFAGVLAGPHSATAKDSHGCISGTFFFTVAQPNAGLAITNISYSAILCHGQTTSATITAANGTAPYQYGIDGVFQTSSTIAGVHGGSHTFSVRDTLGARKDSIVTVAEPLAITINVSTGTISSNGGNTTVDAPATGGTGGLQYSLDNGIYQGSSHFTGVLAGIHTVTVKDGNNCTNFSTFSIHQPGALGITASVTTNPLLCYGDSTDVTIGGTLGTTPYTGTGTFRRAAGTFTFTVTDQFGAVVDTIITITQASQITVTQVVYGTITVVGGTAPVTITVAGGTPVPTNLYYFQIDGGGYVLGGTANTFTFNSVTAGNHTINVKDNNGCIITYQINMPAPPKKGKKPINHIYVNG